MKNYNYEFTAIRTKYNNVWFRSRLEARWAAVFDLVGWKWNYEPFDLNGWIPDFQLDIPITKGTMKGSEDYYGSPDVLVPNPLVEVRPVDKEEYSGTPARAFETPRIEKATNGQGEVFLLGSYIEAAWRVPDLGDWGASMNIWVAPYGKEEQIWREAGNKVQWQGARGA